MLCFAAVFFHPEFAYFRKIAEHNGGHQPEPSGSPLSPLLARRCSPRASGLLALAIARRLGPCAPLFIAAAGLATVAAYRGQAVLYFGFGVASEYAVRKHAYAITTLLAAAAIALAVEVMERGLPRLAKPPPARCSAAAPAR